MDRPLYPDDLVAKRSNDSHLAVVERTHGDVDTHTPYPGREDDSRINSDNDIRKTAFNKFMKDGVPPSGAVLVQWQHAERAQLIPEAKLTLLDRSLLIGDVVKKNPRDAMSGIVINTFTSCTLQPLSEVIVSEGGRNSKKARLLGFPPASGSGDGIRVHVAERKRSVSNVPASELRYDASPTPEDLVVYQDWIGRVVHCSSLLLLRLSDNSVVEVRDDFVEYIDGEIDSLGVGELAKTKKGVLRNGRWVFGQYNPNILPIGTVVQARVVNAEVMWLERRIGADSNKVEPSWQLESDELDSSSFHVYDRTRRPQLSPNALETTSNSEIDARLRLRVRFKDLAGACVKYDGTSEHGKLERLDRKDTLGYDLNVFEVTKFQTDVLVQWQDLTVTRERSIDVVPDLAMDDDHDAWPGEIAHPVELESVTDMPGIKQAKKVCVVQSINPTERMAKVLWSPDASIQYSVDIEDAPDVRAIVTGVVGKATGEIEEVSMYDIEAPGEMNVRRGDIVLIAKPSTKGSESGSDDLDWLGEIVDTRLDGSLTVRLGAAKQVRDVNLKREEVVIAIRSDDMNQIDPWDDNDDEDDESEDYEINSDGELVAVDSDADSQDVSESDDSMDDDLEEENARYEDENGDPMSESDVANEDWESDRGDDVDDEMVDTPERTPPTSHSATPPDTSKRKDGTEAGDAVMQDAPTQPEAYLVLDTNVPSSHHFASKTASQNPAHLKRTMKEHKILRESGNLPNGVYVRTWEGRLDLFRVLIIGPEDTPYADAPFVIDFQLPPSFPSEPPQAFFHSWTVESGLGGVGRVNPNLYEDGKICLSLLGTWESSKPEGWSAGKSTLLQVIVSLLGLVLVQNPYFNEAGYEHLVGLESSKRASELYNERVYLKARTFVLAALARLEMMALGAGVEGLEDLVRWLYKDEDGPQLLEKARKDVEQVLQRSENPKEGETGSPPMSKGACIPLRRVLQRLQEL